MKALQQRLHYGEIEFNQLFPGGKMSEQPKCLTCGKDYYKHDPEAKNGCKCKEEDRKILKDVH